MAKVKAGKPQIKVTNLSAAQKKAGYSQAAGAYNSVTGKLNPVVSSASTRLDNNYLGESIKGLKNAYKADYNLMAQQQAALAARRESEISGIKTAFDIGKAEQESGQQFDYAARAEGLVTSGGGFLGATQSQQGVLQNLKGTHDREKTALLAKREAAILAAETAYEEKDFALAREMSKSAKDLQKEIYGMEKDFADMELAYSREDRAQQEFNMGVTDKKVQAYANMSDDEFDNIDPEEVDQLDKAYFPGFTRSKRDIEKKALTLKTEKDAIALDIDILAARRQMPYGQKFTLGGKTYTGLEIKSSGGGFSKDEKDNDIANIVMNFQDIIKKNGWKGIDPTDYYEMRKLLKTKYGASAALELDKSINDLDLQVDYKQTYK